MVKKMVAGIILTLFIVLLIAVIVGLSSSMKLEIESFAIESKELAKLKIVHISDIHYPNNGVSLASLMSEINYIAPHIIMISGDTFDKSATKQDVKDFEEFFAKLSNLATVFAVIGNHEIGSEILDNLYASCQKSGRRYRGLAPGGRQRARSAARVHAGLCRNRRAALRHVPDPRR